MTLALRVCAVAPGARAGILMLAACSAVAASLLVLPASLPFQHELKTLGLIAHAGGSSRGKPNQRSALVNSYESGHRYFEVDFSWTMDGHLVAAHDWNSHGVGRPQPPTLRAFYRLSPPSERMDIHDVCRWRSSHRGAKIVLDIKSRRIAGLKRVAEACGTRGIIPQVHSSAEYAWAERLGFREIILTTYVNSWSTKVMRDFLDAHTVLAVTIPRRRLEEHLTLLSHSHPDVCVMTHTVNDFDDFKALRRAGVCAVYSDHITPGGPRDTPVRHLH